MTKDTQPYAFIRRGDSLVPEMEYDLSALDGVAQGQRVKIEIKQWRNSARLRAYWAMLRECVIATECAPTVNVLHEEIKLNTGLVQFVRFKGMLVQIPASIAMDKLGEAEMIAHFERAERYLAEAYGWAGKDVA